MKNCLTLWELEKETEKLSAYDLFFLTFQFLNFWLSTHTESLNTFVADNSSVSFWRQCNFEEPDLTIADKESWYDLWGSSLNKNFQYTREVVIYKYPLQDLHPSVYCKINTYSYFLRDRHLPISFCEADIYQYFITQDDVFQHSMKCCFSI